MRVTNCISLINEIELNAKKKNLFFNCLLTKKKLRLIKLLKNKAIVKNYTRLKFNLYRISLVYSRQTFLVRQKLFFPKKKIQLTLSLQALKKLTFNLKSSFLILETTKGLITHNEALKLRLGGSLFLIYF